MEMLSLTPALRSTLTHSRSAADLLHLFVVYLHVETIEGLHERTEYIDFFLPITQSCSVSDVLFTGGRAVSDFSVLK